METITLYLPTKLAASVRSVAVKRGQKLPDFILTELQRFSLPLLKNDRNRRTSSSRKATTDFHNLSEERLMELVNARMKRALALQMHRLIHLGGARQLSEEEHKLLDILLEIHNDIGIKKTQAIGEAIRRGLLPPLHDSYWTGSLRRKLAPRKNK